MSRDHSLSQDLTEIFAAGEGDVTLRELLAKTDHKSFGFFFVLLGLPIALPATPPGLSTPFGFLLGALALQVVLGRDTPWLPPQLLDRKMKRGSQKFIGWMTKVLRFFERLLRPRLSFLYHDKVFRYFLGPVALLSAVVLSFPFPLTNSLPALAIFLIGLGMLEEDGLAGLAGVVVAMAGLALGVALVFFLVRFGPQGYEMMVNWLRGLRG